MGVCGAAVLDQPVLPDRALKRGLKPLRTLASLEGARVLVDNAMRVLRWGLWMAPVIYSFLKASPDPPGTIRTA